MDTNDHKLTSASWEAYTLAMVGHDDPPWPFFHDPSSAHLLPSLGGAAGDDEDDEPEEELGAMKEMMFNIAAMQPVDIDPATIRKPRRRNVRISDDPQSVAARHRRERISEKIRILQRLVPGGTKMDTASMLDEAIRYVKFLKRQIRVLQANPSCVGVPSADPYLFGGNSSNEGPAADHPMCFNHKFN